jgi:DNA-binding XRE family transcriptional regulator
MKIQNRLEKRLSEKNLTRQDLEFIVQMSRQGILNLMRGQAVPKIGTAYRIAHALDCDVGDIWPEEQFIHGSNVDS